MRVLFFGDSIVQGFFDSQGGWAMRLANFYHHKSLQGLTSDWTDALVLGISGNTVEDVLARIKNESEPRHEPEGGMVIVLAVGINDATLQNNIANMDVYKFQKHYEKLIDTAEKLADHVLCVGLSAVDENLTDPYQFSSSGKQFKNNRIDAFEDCIKQSCGRKSVPFVPVYDVFQAALAQGHILLSDGLHPNDAGHKLIARLVKLELDKLLK